MSSFIGKFRRKKATVESERGEDSCVHRDSLNSDHIYIPQNSGSLSPPSADIGSGSDQEGIHVRKKPRLAYSLDRLLVDSSALSYFIQYLECTEKLNLIKFWMHVEGFKASFSEEIPAAQDLSLLDAKSIYEKYICEDSPASLALPKKIKKLIDEQIERRPLSKYCFEEAQEFVRQLFQYRYFEEFQSSVYYKKHELEVLSSGCSLSDILKVQHLLLSFLEFINDKEDHDMIQFLLSCDSFEGNSETMEDSEVLGDAMALYDKYFSMQATNMIDLGQTIRSEMESLICDESGRPNSKVFQTAKTACYYRLHDKYIHTFTKSHAYLYYLSELRSFIENTIELPRRERLRNTTGSQSDAQSSTDSLSNAFSRHLDILEQKKNQDEDKTPIATPNTSKKSTPRTPRSSRLAEIDDMGRYHALYDDSHAYSQTVKTPMRLKSTLRKYLDKNILREEEIAEEVARTIIRDMQHMVASASNSA